jgi:hypothetical protein
VRITSGGSRGLDPEREAEMNPGGMQSIEETILSKEKAAMERWRYGDPLGWAEISADEVTYIDPGLVQLPVPRRVQSVSQTAARQPAFPAPHRQGAAEA